MNLNPAGMVCFSCGRRILLVHLSCAPNDAKYYISVAGAIRYFEAGENKVKDANISTASAVIERIVQHRQGSNSQYLFQMLMGGLRGAQRRRTTPFLGIPDLWAFIGTSSPVSCRCYIGEFCSLHAREMLNLSHPPSFSSSPQSILSVLHRPTACTLNRPE
jgi:hypothetical protein